MTTTLSMKATERLEIGYGRVLEDRKQWVYGEYFPKYGPLMAQHGLRNLVPFAVLDSNVKDIAPVQGSLSSWPSAEHRVRLHEEPAFAAIVPLRDAAIPLSDGHLFEPLTDAIEFDDEGEFALVIGPADVPAGEALFRTPLAADSASSLHAGRHLSLHRWSDACAKLLAGSSDRAVVLRVVLNPSAKG